MRQIWIKSILKIRSFSSIVHIVKNQNISRLTKREILRKCCSSTISRFFVCTEKTESTFLSVPGRSGDRVQSGFPLTAGAVVFLSLLVFSPRTALIALLAAAVSLGFLLLISRYSAQNAPVEAQANRDMTGAILEYARGLAVVKSFGRDIPLEHFDIAFDHVSFGYDDRQVLHDVSFTIPEKTVVDYPVFIGGQSFNITCVDVGNPHCVVFCPRVDDVDVDFIGPRFEHAPYFPERINTEFIRVVNPSTIKMRVWERGSGETMACGTGACAAVVAAVANGMCEKGRDVTVRAGGGDLVVNYTDEKITLTGDAKLVYTGEAEY